MKVHYLALLLAYSQLMACSYFFPDKEKDYKYSQEIVRLEIPPSLDKTVNSTNSETEQISVSLVRHIEFIKDESSYLFLNVKFPYAWRIMSKAITSQLLEITDKNRQESLYYVQYDPDFKPVEDGSFWHEVLFFFADDVHQEKGYQIYLTKLKQGTAVFVRDEQGHTISEGDGLKLLELLFQTIKKDFSGQ